MNQLDSAQRARVIAALVEGNSIRSVSRMTGVARNTISTLLFMAGAACARYQDEALRSLPCKRVQCDEIWSFCYAKDKNVPAEKRGEFGIGTVWTWTALDADTKLIASWMVGGRDAVAAHEFMKDLAGRLANRVQLTTDGHAAYLSAVENNFGNNIDYAMLVKIYGETAEAEKRYSPAECIGCTRKEISGKPDHKHISTSFVERQNLTMRMHMRRFTRLTNGFSKKIENHVAAIALHFMYYNFVRIHQTLRITPAMAARVSDRVWEVSDIVKLVDDYREQRIREGQENSRKATEKSYNPFGSALGQ
ncbi:MAG: DDE-type integrase/transposase/recombinase [Acidobacteriota bacterium]|nr:DDE-type integrase/transposase/recombinase [Acidobacteriota bacterium]